MKELNSTQVELMKAIRVLQIVDVQNQKLFKIDSRDVRKTRPAPAKLVLRILRVCWSRRRLWSVPKAVCEKLGSYFSTRVSTSFCWCGRVGNERLGSTRAPHDNSATARAGADRTEGTVSRTLGAAGALLY